MAEEISYQVPFRTPATKKREHFSPTLTLSIFIAEKKCTLRARGDLTKDFAWSTLRKSVLR